jgi:hypothetical protein
MTKGAQTKRIGRHRYDPATEKCIDCGGSHKFCLDPTSTCKKPAADREGFPTDEPIDLSE